MGPAPIPRNFKMCMETSQKKNQPNFDYSFTRILISQKRYQHNKICAEKTHTEKRETSQ